MKCYLCEIEGVLICGNCPKLFCRECIANHYRGCKKSLHVEVSAAKAPEPATEKK